MRVTLVLSWLLLGASASLAAPSEDSEAPTPEVLTPEARSAILLPPNSLTREGFPGFARNNEICGIRRNSVPDVITRIVGGSPAETHEFPWQVSLQWRYNWYTYHICGASVIDQNWIITAAHCTHQFTPKELLVVAGDHLLKEKEGRRRIGQQDVEGSWIERKSAKDALVIIQRGGFVNFHYGSEQSRYIERIVEHEFYDANTQENDIALIKLSSPLELDGMTVSPTCLPPPMTNFTGDCVVTGWGKLREGGKSADLLQKVIVPIISDKECEDSYRVIGYTGPVVDSMMCAGHEFGGKDACQGDSGGPFACRGADNRYYLAGIVSWGIGCARPNVPGVYTEVSRYINWIDDVVNSRIDIPIRPASLRSSSIEEEEV
ncbi:trypsin [Penaeus vannamei]|uniref:Trypsin n=1 Tax=Penaeus vannamei TaxID=6689 RepID=A0A3R7QZG8_PENVA|nr:trypsin [Penaeus vannamei]